MAKERTTYRRYNSIEVLDRLVEDKNQQSLQILAKWKLQSSGNRNRRAFNSLCQIELFRLALQKDSIDYSNRAYQCTFRYHLKTLAETIDTNDIMNPNIMSPLPSDTQTQQTSSVVWSMTLSPEWQKWYDDSLQAVSGETAANGFLSDLSHVGFPVENDNFTSRDEPKANPYMQVV